MKKIFALSALVLGLSFATLPTFADTLHFVSDSGQNIGGEDVYPYNFNINGSTAITSLICLDINRTISFGETWNVNVVSLPHDHSATFINYRADAWIYSQLGAYSNAEIQYAIWDIFDPTDTAGHAGFDATAQTLAATALQMAVNQSLINSGFFSGFTLYIPTSDQTGWTNGIPQEFIGAAQTPEPSSLILLGTGLLTAAGTLRRKLARS